MVGIQIIGNIHKVKRRESINALPPLDFMNVSVCNLEPFKYVFWEMSVVDYRIAFVAF